MEQVSEAMDGACPALQRQSSCTQPYIDIGASSLDAVASQSAVMPVAILRSLVAGKAPDVSIFAETEDIVIGRAYSLSCSEHLRVTVDDKRVSGEHCRIWRGNSETVDSSTPYFFVQDSSSNGTFLNGKRLEKHKQYSLQSGDELSLVVNSSGQKHRGTKSLLFCAFVFRVLGVERSSVLKDAGNLLEERYELLSKVLGSGAFSQVLLCKSRSTGTTMALKRVDKKRFVQFRKSRNTQLTVDSEREVMEKVEHPNIVRLIETFDTSTCLYLVMELLPGGDLLQRILDYGIYSEGATKRLFGDILSGIKCLHDSDLVHRDIKPENILLTSTDDDGIAKIADMGLAKYVGGYASAQMQRATVCGTPHYFAPEMVQAAEGGPALYGKAIDMWAAGVVLYIMLCGFPPFDEDKLYDQIGAGQYDFDTDQWRSVSGISKDLVEKLMRVNPDERLTISKALSHPWMTIGRKRKSEVPEGDCATTLDRCKSDPIPDSSRRVARKVATPRVLID
jgi:serine/threonine-protein kinase Chk2